MKLTKMQKPKLHNGKGNKIERGLCIITNMLQKLCGFNDPGDIQRRKAYLKISKYK